MDQAFEHLFSNVSLGPFELRNRVCFSAHSHMMGNYGLPTERQLRYLVERAKGGAAWIVVGASMVSADGLDYINFNIVSDERSIPMNQQITAAVHDHGAIITTQIDEFGRVGRYPREGRAPLLAPSALPELGHEMPKEMEAEDFEAVIADTRLAVRVAKAGGFDGVEFLAAMSTSLIQQFLSPLTNRREDEYGGSLENRLRFPLRLIRETREELGRDHILGIKLVADEVAQGGLDHDALREIAAAIDGTGDVDYIHADIGTGVSVLTHIPEMQFPAGFATYLAGGIREVVRCPVVSVKRINDPVLAEQVLASGQADIVAMARALIADPELPNKAREGRLTQVRQCTGSNQECINRTSASLPVSCIHNPAAGHEDRFGIGTLKPAVAPKRVLVVGGGVAGMAAAEIAAKRGHDVHLHERSDELGGQVRWMASINSRKDYESITRYLSGEIERLGVQVRLGHAVDAEEVLADAWDEVVVATGARPDPRGYSSALPVFELPGADQDNVFTVFDVFGDRMGEIGDRVLLIDEFGEPEAMMVAEHLGDQGRKVEIVTRLNYVGMKVDWFSWGAYAERLSERGAVLTALTGVTRIDGRTVIGENLDGEWRREVDSVVLVMGKLAEDHLYRALKGRASSVHRVGDCVAPRRITDAIWEGNALAREL